MENANRGIDRNSSRPPAAVRGANRDRRGSQKGGMPPGARIIIQQMQKRIESPPPTAATSRAAAARVKAAHFSANPTVIKITGSKHAAFGIGLGRQGALVGNGRDFGPRWYVQLLGFLAHRAPREALPKLVHAPSAAPGR